MLGYEASSSIESQVSKLRQVGLPATWGDMRQFSFERVNMYISYIERRNNAWILASRRKDKEWYFDPGSHPTEDDKKIYRRLYNGVFGEEETEVPGLTLLLHQIRLGKQIDLVRDGVPLFGTFSRGLVWQLYSGALFEGMLENPTEYSDAMVRFNKLEFKQESNPRHVNYNQILVDKPRTFPDNPGLDDVREGPFVRVLMAYCFRNPKTNYSQSMNYIATNLLLHTGETQAYWLLVQIIEKITPNYWEPESHQFGGKVDILACQLIVEDYFPGANIYYGEEVTSLLGFGGVPTQILMSLGNNILSPEMVNRVLDLLFHVEGVKILFRVIIITNRLLKDYFDFEVKKIGDLSQVDPAIPFYKLLLDLQYNYDTDKLISMCFDETMKIFDGTEGDKLIDKFRARAHKIVNREAAAGVAERKAFKADKAREARERTPILYKAFEWAGVDPSLIDVESNRKEAMDQVRQEKKPLPRGVTFKKIMQELSPGLMAVYKQFFKNDDPTFSMDMIDMLKQFVITEEAGGGTPSVSSGQIYRETAALGKYGAFETKGRNEEFAQTLLP